MKEANIEVQGGEKIFVPHGITRGPCSLEADTGFGHEVNDF
jgi:hypothetical protein